MKSKLILTVLSILIFSCQENNSKLYNESKAIIKLLYNIESNKFPVPAPPSENSTTIMPITKMSVSDRNIHEIKFAITKADFDTKKGNYFSKEFSKIILAPKSVFLTKNLRDLDVKDINGIKIPIVTAKGKIQDIAKNNKVLGVLFYSDIKFNDNFTKAIIQFGAYTHELSGYTSIICLEKKLGLWQIINSKNLSES